ncbi:MAG: polysaccharide biosynthesis/export family protein [Pseudomonadota bacterium]
MVIDLAGRTGRGIALLCAVLFSVAPVLADTATYRLVPGDRIVIDYSAGDAAFETTVDLDGQIRLSEIGGVDVAGLTLDEAEELIEVRLTDSELFVNARADISLIGYAPVVITGNVSAPGRYDFLAGMTVSSAVGIAGGSFVGGLTGLDLARTTSDLRARLRLFNLEVAALVVRIARLQATLSDTPEVLLSEELLDTIPMPEVVQLDLYRDAEAAILTNARSQANELLSAWQEEIDALSEQQRILDLRLESQEILVANAEEAFANAQTLNERGLQTTAGLAAAEQSLVTAQARIFELESLQITLIRSISEAVRARAQYRRQVQEDALVALHDAQIDLDDAVLRYSQVVEQLGLLSNGNVAGLLDSGAVEISYSIISPRDGREEETAVTPDTRLLPGDTLVVDVNLSAIGVPGADDS